MLAHVTGTELHLSPTAATGVYYSLGAAGQRQRTQHQQLSYELTFRAHPHFAHTLAHCLLARAVSHVAPFSIINAAAHRNEVTASREVLFSQT